VARYNQLLAVLTAVVVVGAMQIMGVILVAAMLVVPVAGAAQVSRSFTGSLLSSVVLAELAVIVGIGLSYYGEATAGGVIVLVAVAIYVACIVLGRLRTALGEESAAETARIDASGADSKAEPTTD
jgi:zinc transport system permease protein